MRIVGFLGLFFLMATIAKSQNVSTIVDEGKLIHSDIPPSGIAIIDQSNLYNTAQMRASNLPGCSYWQSFTAGISGTLSEIELGFFNYINGIGTLNVFKGIGIEGKLLNSQSVNVNCAGGNCLLPFAENVEIVAGLNYTFQFIPGKGISGIYEVQVEFAGSCDGGIMGVVDPSGTDSISGMDLVFRTHVIPTSNRMRLSNSHVFPNPSNGEFKITNNEFCISGLEIVDITAHKIYSQLYSEKVKAIDINLSENFPSGIYFVKIFSGQHFQFEKIIIQ